MSEKKPKGRKPEFRVAAMDKETDEKNSVGAAWINEDGTITVKLDAFVHLVSSPNLLITLFPNTP